MSYDPKIHHRRSIRLKGYDYARAGAYFVTIITENHVCLLGEVVGGKMQLNEAGQVVEQWWLELNRKYPHIETSEHVVMPNHFHGIVIIVGDKMGAHIGAPLPEIVQWFKTMTTNEYIRGVKTFGWAPFSGRLWQRNYYECIIRNETSERQIREYIRNNPPQWDTDCENPSRFPVGADLCVCPEHTANSACEAPGCPIEYRPFL